jgi:hypothetical protein
MTVHGRRPRAQRDARVPVAAASATLSPHRRRNMRPGRRTGRRPLVGEGCHKGIAAVVVVVPIPFIFAGAILRRREQVGPRHDQFGGDLGGTRAVPGARPLVGLLVQLGLEDGQGPVVQLPKVAVQAEGLPAHPELLRRQVEGGGNGHACRKTTRTRR